MKTVLFYHARRDFSLILTKADVATRCEDENDAAEALQDAERAFLRVQDYSLLTAGLNPTDCRLKMNAKILKAKARVRPQEAFAELIKQRRRDAVPGGFQERLDRLETGLQLLRFINKKKTTP